MTEEVKDELTAPGAWSAESCEQPGLEATATEQAEEPVPRLTLGQPTRRRRTSKVDPVLAEAREVALAGLADIAPEHSIGSLHHLRGEEERLTTHLFECTLPGYRGWFWFATLSRAPRSKVATVCEIGLLPGDDALLAPAWVPWAERVLPEDHEDTDYEGADFSPQEGEPAED
ncbi:MAG: DUF3027 domain-containing protein [Rothia sp. (in: high G+C Gram-positive bacteria)]|nr:DUF3027 domain-containing protein [Rothia sp. (in: high G+C Gram-positive bacteria)]